MTKKLKSLILDTRGQDLIEYALMAGFVSVAAGAVMPSVSTAIGGVFAKATAAMTSITPPATSGETSMIRIVCAVLAVLFLVLIVMRRKKSAEGE